MLLFKKKVIMIESTIQSTMNSYNRFLDILKGKPVDFIPRTPILMQFAAEYIGSNYSAFASDYRVLVEANLRCAKDFGMDQVSTISDPYRETQGYGANIHDVSVGGDGCCRCRHAVGDRIADGNRVIAHGRVGYDK